MDLATSKGTYFFQNYAIKKSTPWFKNKGLQREYIVTINRLRADHYNLASSFARIKIVGSPACHCGFEFQDIEHVIWEYSTFSRQRNDMVKKLNEIKNLTLPTSVKKLLEKPDSKECKYIYQLLVDSNLKI